MATWAQCSGYANLFTDSRGDDADPSNSGARIRTRAPQSLSVALCVPSESQMRTPAAGPALVSNNARSDMESRPSKQLPLLCAGGCASSSAWRAPACNSWPRVHCTACSAAAVFLAFEGWFIRQQSCSTRRLCAPPGMSKEVIRVLQQMEAWKTLFTSMNGLTRFEETPAGVQQSGSSTAENILASLRSSSDSTDARDRDSFLHVRALPCKASTVSAAGDQLLLCKGAFRGSTLRLCTDPADDDLGSTSSKHGSAAGQGTL